MNRISNALKMQLSANWLLKALIGTLIVLIFLLDSCASVQSPTGGPRDSIPPKILRESPPNLSKNFKATEIEIEFDEFIKLSNEFTEVSFSPSIDVVPSFMVRKDLLEIKFSEPLEENTTYTINFGKAITDVNESNQLKNYTYVFSTGNQIDSLSISGTVISALTKEKMSEATVFILPVKQDSLFGKKRASIFSTTDSSGNFRLQNLREDTYRIYALKESGGDRIYNSPTEEIGFLKDPISLTKDTSGITLQVFRESAPVFNIVDRKIEPDGRIFLSFNQTLPVSKINIIDPAGLDSRKITHIVPTNDSAFVWLPELTFDSIKVAVTSGNIGDTVLIRRGKKDEYNRAVSVTDNLTGSKLRPSANLILKFSAPVSPYAGNGITLQEDSLQVRNFQIVKDSLDTRRVVIRYPWRMQKEYTLKMSEGAFTDVFGNKSKPFSRKFSQDSNDNYGSISIKVSVPDTTKMYLVQWLGERDEVLRQDAITRNVVLNYTTYPTAKYRIRVIYDENRNGRWDTGNLIQKKQPELTFTLDKVISLRPNWDLEETFTIPPQN